MSVAAVGPHHVDCRSKENPAVSLRNLFTTDYYWLVDLNIEPGAQDVFSIAFYFLHCPDHSAEDHVLAMEWGCMEWMATVSSCLDTGVSCSSL